MFIEMMKADFIEQLKGGGPPWEINPTGKYVKVFQSCKKFLTVSGLHPIPVIVQQSGKVNEAKCKQQLYSRPFRVT